MAGHTRQTQPFAALFPLTPGSVTQLGMIPPNVWVSNIDIQPTPSKLTEITTKTAKALPSTVGRSAADQRGFEAAKKATRKPITGSVTVHAFKSCPMVDRSCHLGIWLGMRRSDSPPSWFVENLNAGGSAGVNLQNSQLWASWLLDESGPFKALVEHFKTDPDFELADTYVSFNPKLALEAGLSPHYIQNFLICLRAHLENSPVGLTSAMPFLRKQTDINLNLLVGLALRHRCPDSRVTHDPFELWQKATVRNFYNGHANTTSPSVKQVFNGTYTGRGAGMISVFEDVKWPVAKKLFGVSQPDFTHHTNHEHLYELLRSVVDA